MICVVIKGPTYAEAFQQISGAVAYAQVVELRLDYFRELDEAAIMDLKARFSIPMVFTLRSRSQGGHYPHSEESRLADILRLITLKPEYFDLEHDVSLHLIEEIASRYPDTKIILSYHNFRDTPQDLDKIYRDMKKIPSHYYKMAVTAHHCTDALRLLDWKKQTDHRLIAISMGLHGQITRILGPVVGSPMTYAALDDDLQSAPGQLTAKTLIERYHHQALSSRTKVYGLIGDPVDKSISDVTHNQLLSACGFDAIYVKMQVRPDELPDFLQYAKKLPFHGLSVTMPLKECMIPLIDRINADEIDLQAQEIGAVNTLVFENGKMIGFNTDGIGALNAIEEKYSVKGKRIVIIGAGGAAKAIAYEGCRRGGKVTIVNRDAEKAFHLARHLQCKGKGLDSLSKICREKGYDILINCTSVSLPILPEDILPGKIVMDISTKPKETDFLKVGLEKGCQVIYGYQMFVEQALGQFRLWFKQRFNIQNGKIILEKAVKRCLEGHKSKKKRMRLP